MVDVPKYGDESPSYLSLLLSSLGYVEGNGWVWADQFDQQERHRFVLEQARQEMSVLGAFCLHQPMESNFRIEAPLVYVAQAAELEAAQEIHKKVWSQGLVPFLLVLLPESIVLCNGFSYSGEVWSKSVKIIDIKTAQESLLLEGGVTNDFVATTPVGELHASRLKTSLFWRDHIIDVACRVDRRLLQNLERLSSLLINGVGCHSRLGPSAANSLIGRFLYLYFLVDRKIISQPWIDERGHSRIVVDDANAVWPASETWDFFDDLDSIFNGSIFPISEYGRNSIDETHIGLVRSVIRHAATPSENGALQLSFFDFYLGALRTETLSAVYEQFLENQKPGNRRQDGAFYTPPYLVDFILDRLEDELPLQNGTTVLDPAAGSGVFLVGCYRRIIEDARSKQKDRLLTLDQLRALLLNNIFGVELNEDACNVAAFSLYLTLLDYVTPRDLKEITGGRDPNTLFPSLVGETLNIRPMNFFSESNCFRGFPNQFSCVVGNPPWKAKKGLGTESAEAWHDETKKDAPIGNLQIAELFLWKALRTHLKAGGLLALLIPTKSLTFNKSREFRDKLQVGYRVVGAADFSHLRYKIFSGAKEAPVALLVENRRPTHKDYCWVYSPVLVDLPIAHKQKPWSIIFDRSSAEHFRVSQIAGHDNGWYRAFTQRPVDRQIVDYIEDGILQGNFSTIGAICEDLGIAIGQGGTPEQTNLPGTVHLNAQKWISANSGSLFADSMREEIFLPNGLLERVAQGYIDRFSGNVLIIPKRLYDIRFVEQPIAFNKTFMAAYAKERAGRPTVEQRAFLKGLGHYLNSDLMSYFAAMFAPRWLQERHTISGKELLSIPVPWRDSKGLSNKKILNLSGESLRDFVLGSFDLGVAEIRAVQEFINFRSGFRDGNVPSNAISKPEDVDVDAYRGVLAANLDNLMGRKGAFEVAVMAKPDLGIGAIAVRFKDERSAQKLVPLETICSETFENFQNSCSSVFTTSLNGKTSHQNAYMSFIKPLELYRWTLESAVSDSRKMLRSLVSGSV